MAPELASVPVVIVTGRSDVYYRHFQIGDNEVGNVLSHDVQRLRAVHCFIHIVALGFKDDPEDSPEILVVFYDQDSFQTVILPTS